MSANFVANTVTDKLSRNFEYLRISVTDRCNFRCSYCMPSDIFNKDYSYVSQDNILSYEEIIDICKLLKKIGLKKVRITGGEPLLRKNIDKLIFKLKTEVMLDRVSMTTNGSLLSDDKVSELKKSGLDSITLSLDTLDKDKISVINGTKKNFNLLFAAFGLHVSYRGPIYDNGTSNALLTPLTTGLSPLGRIFGFRRQNSIRIRS